MAATDEAKSPKEKTQDYVESIREGAIAANIFVATAQDGLTYHYFKISRAFKGPKSKSWQYSDRMFPRNAKAIAKVSLEAAKRCEELDGKDAQEAA